jgi:hypothetical protein
VKQQAKYKRRSKWCETTFFGVKQNISGNVLVFTPKSTCFTPTRRELNGYQDVFS